MNLHLLEIDLEIDLVKLTYKLTNKIDLMNLDLLEIDLEFDLVKLTWKLTWSN